jgi:hypothetical protein
LMSPTGRETRITYKSRKRRADEKKGSKKGPKKREKGNLHKPKTARQYRMELEREIRQDESMDLSTKHEGNEVQHYATFVKRDAIPCDLLNLI